MTAQRPLPHATQICFVAPFGLGQKTTVWARTLPLARELVRRGHTVTILIPPWDTPADAGRQWQDEGVELVNVQIAGGTAPTTFRLLRELHRRTPDLVHIVKPRAHAGLVQWWLWRQGRSQRPLLVLDIDDWEQAWAPLNRYPWPVARFLAWQEEWGIRHAHGITAASRWLEARARSYAPGTPVCYLPNGVAAPAQPAPAASVGARQVTPAANVLFFTRFVEIEPDWLAALWQEIQAQLPDARLFVAGTPVQPGLDAPFRTALAAAPSVAWLGYVTQAQQVELYAQSACAIFPAAPVPLQQAKCSVRLATTLLAGAPVVASAVGEQAHYGADGAAVLVPPGAAPATFAAAVVQVLRNPDQQRALSAAGIQRLQERYAWPRLGGSLDEFYSSLGGNNARGSK